MRYSSGTFQFGRIIELAGTISSQLAVTNFRVLAAGENVDFTSRYGARINAARDQARILVDHLLVLEDGSGHGPPVLARKVLELCQGDAANGS